MNTLFFKNFLICAGMLCILFLMPQQSPAQRLHTGKPQAAKKCAICHYKWTYAFLTEHRAGELVPYQEQPTVHTEPMCLSCHDGSVIDSRRRVFNDPGHRAGVLPSSKIRIPEIFPLDIDGKLLCTTCHTPHALPSDMDNATDIFLRGENTNSQFCKNCHLDKQGNTETGNHPVDISNTNTPEIIIENGGLFGKTLPHQIICQTCHTPHGSKENNFLILPVEDLQTRSILCETCHTKKPGKAKKLAFNNFTHPLDLTPGKSTHIPDKWKNGEKVVLGTKGELVCRTCHTPHAAADKEFLLTSNNRNDEMCIQCHQDEGEIKDSDHYTKVLTPDEKNIKEEPAAEIGPCSPCHLPHRGTGALMWARKIKNADQKPGEYCKNCHRTDGSAEKKMPKDFSHPMDIPLPEGATSLTLPLFDDVRGENLNGKIRCATCHSFHNPYPVYDDLDQPGVQHGTFIRLAKDGPTAICNYCHPQHAMIEGSDHDLRITAPEFINNSGQRSHQASACSPCHLAHNADMEKYLWSTITGPPLLDGWIKEYTNDTDFMTSLCTGCHSAGNVADKQVPQFGLHPKGFFVPEKENIPGKPSFHFEMVKNEFPIYTPDGKVNLSGNIVCSTCHNPHQWDPHVTEKGPGKNVEGNVTNSFLRPKLHSSFCTECHGKGGLIKFKYYHSHIGRDKIDHPFSFK